VLRLAAQPPHTQKGAVHDPHDATGGALPGPRAWGAGASASVRSNPINKTSARRSSRVLRALDAASATLQAFPTRTPRGEGGWLKAPSRFSVGVAGQERPPRLPGGVVASSKQGSLPGKAGRKLLQINDLENSVRRGRRFLWPGSCIRTTPHPCWCPWPMWTSARGTIRRVECPEGR